MTRREAKRIAYRLAWRCLEGDVGMGLAYGDCERDEDGVKIEQGLHEIVAELRRRAGEE